MILLRPVLHGDPFAAHPQLCAIWPEPSLSRARADTVESLDEIDDEDFGAIYLIVDGSEVIGITGFYRYDLVGLELGLRWHGLVPHQRGRQLSQAVVTTVIGLAKHAFPQAKVLIELIPDTAYSAPISTHFRKLGFGPIGMPERLDGSAHAWQPFHLPIERAAATVTGDAGDDVVVIVSRPTKKMAAYRSRPPS